MQEEKKKSRKEGDKARLAAAAARLGVLQRRDVYQRQKQC